MVDKKYGSFDIHVHLFRNGAKHPYHAKGSPEEHFLEMKNLDKEGLINWDKTKDIFKYKHCQKPILLIDNTYGQYEITPSEFKQGARHPYHTYGSPEEHYNTMKKLDIENHIDWDKTKEKFIYTKNQDKVYLYDIEYGWFKMTPASFKQGARHSKRNKGTDLSKTCLLYLLEIETKLGKCQKIGITTKTINKRYELSERKYFKVLSKIKFDSGYEAKKIENLIKSKYKENIIPKKYYPLKTGYTETFLQVNILPDLKQMKLL